MTASIVDGEVRPFRLAAPALETGKGVLGRREGVVFVLRDEAGRRGVGEATPVPGFGCEDASASAAALARLLSRALGRTPDERAALLACAAQKEPEAPAARFAFDTALADLAAQAASLPLADWLAGGQAPRRRVDVNGLIASAEPADVACAARAGVLRGIRTFKLKVGSGELGADVERVRALRSALGPAPRIRLDANGAFVEEEALRALGAFAAFDIDYCEEPITVRSEADLAAWARLRCASRVPLAADECLARPEVADALLEAGTADVFVLKPSVLGGLCATRDLAARARRAGVTPVVTAGLDAAIGLVATLHCAASLEGDLPACGLATSEWLDEDLAPPPPIEDGSLAVPARPGLGVDLETETPWLAARAQASPRAAALALPDRNLCYAELAVEASRLWAALQERGLQRGDVVALWMDSAELATSFHALVLGGAVLLPVNLRLTDAEVAFQLADAGVRWLLYGARQDADRIDRVAREAQAAAGRACTVSSLSLAELSSSAAAAEPVPPAGAVPLDPERAFAILYTSGTTGRPKGAVLTAANFRASAAASRARLGNGAGDRTLACMPLYHVGGLSILVRALLTGSCVVVHDGFDPEAVARALDSDGITDVSFVANMLARVIDARGGEAAPRSLCSVLVGGGPLPEPLALRARAQGYPIAPTYGLTESTAQVATRTPWDAGAIGLRPLHGVEVEVDAPAGEPGEIRVRGANVMRGYRGLPTETANALRHGWLWTGDVGRIEADGTLTVLDRRSDLIVSGGENVYPAEIEAVLLAHPDVAEAGVGRRADARFGARPVAWWVGADVSDAALGDWCASRLARFKVPVAFHRVGELPRTASGKLVRSRLAE